MKLAVNKNDLRITFANVYLDLTYFKEKEDVPSFNDLVLSILPEIKKYINRRLKAAIHQGHFSKGKYKSDDFVDQLFIEIYDKLNEVKDKNEFYKWLFKKTNQLLDDAIIEEEFDDYFFENIDDYSEPEWKDMIEKYTVDGGGDFVMLEELDETSFNPEKEDLLSPFFIEYEQKDLIEKIDQELTAEEVHQHINFVLDSLPLRMRNVYDLFYGAQFSIKEIAEITNNSPEEVDDLLKDAKVRIKRSFEKRF